MHFQIIKDEYYPNIISHLKLIVPEFKTIFDDDEIYPALASFSEFLISNVEKDGLFNKCIMFINEAIERGKHSTEDVIVLQVFQLIYKNDDVIEKIKPKLSKEAILLFNKFLLLTNKS